MRAFALLLAIGILLIGIGVPILLSVTFTLAPALVIVAATRVQIRCAEQPVALRALVSFRAPPSLA
jgi:hypothetical protein